VIINKIKANLDF